MPALATFGLTALVVFILWSQYGLGAGLMGLALAAIVFIGTMVMAEEGNRAIQVTTFDN
jgi:hypothetical protein